MKTTDTPASGLLTTKEAAAWLRITPRYLYKLASLGEIPRVKLGTAARYDVRDLQAYVDDAKDSQMSAV